MNTRSPTLARMAVVALFALSCFGIGLFIWQTFGGTVPLQPAGYRFHVLFGAEATQLSQGSDVRISGVRVGHVVTTEPSGRRIDALVELDRAYAPLPADARAVVRLKTLLGESFVELSPGSPGGARLPEGGTLAPSRVAATQTVDQVVATFDRPTRRAVRRFFTGLSVAVRGRGDDLNAVLGNARPASADIGRLGAVLDAERPALAQLIRDSGRALDRVGRRASDVRQLVRSGEAVFGATAAQDRALTATIRVLPTFLRRLRATMAGIDGAASDAAPALRTLRPVAPLVRPALDGTARLAPEVRRTFARLDPILRASGRTLPALTRTLRATAPLVDELQPSGRQLVPVVQLLELYRDDLVGSLANGAAASKGTVSGKHALRILLPINNEITLGQRSRQGSSRWNPYPAPGAALDLAVGKGALDCRQADGPTVPTSTPPPCLQAAPWSFQGQTRQYPHVEPHTP